MLIEQFTIVHRSNFSLRSLHIRSQTQMNYKIFSPTVKQNNSSIYKFINPHRNPSISNSREGEKNLKAKGGKIKFIFSYLILLIKISKIYGESFVRREDEERVNHEALAVP